MTRTRSSRLSSNKKTLQKPSTSNKSPKIITKAKKNKNSKEILEIKAEKLNEKDLILINEILTKLCNLFEPTGTCLRTKRSSIFKKNRTMNYEPVEFIFKMLKRLLPKTLSVQRIMYSKKSVKKGILNVPIISDEKFRKLIQKTCGTSNVLHLYLMNTTGFSKTQEFENAYETFTSEKYDRKTKLMKKQKIECKKICDFFSNEENVKGKQLPLQINSNNKKNIYNPIIFGENNKGIILSSLTTSEYKDSMQRSNEHTRFYSWYKNDPILFLKNLYIIVKNINEFNENFDYPLEFKVINLDQELREKIKNNNLFLYDLFEILSNSEEISEDNQINNEPFEQSSSGSNGEFSNSKSISNFENDQVDNNSKVQSELSENISPNISVNQLNFNYYLNNNNQTTTSENQIGYMLIERNKILFNKIEELQNEIDQNFKIIKDNLKINPVFEKSE